MQKRQLGTSEIYITPIIMGTWQAGKQMWAGIEDAETIKAALDRLRPIADRHQTSLGNLALAWLITSPKPMQLSARTILKSKI
jgi:aryl-alcohol dehydrogenase-like predicted oxidoreductase